MSKASRKLQIGVMGSAADLNYSDELADLAKQVGAEIAKAGAILMFGAEKDYDSLSYTSSIGASEAGGLTVGITYGGGLEHYGESDITIATGLERGGGRELTLVLSCDAIICLSGGSGTLTEIAIAYQANIPVIAIKGTGGWSDKLLDQYLDERKRLKVTAADSPQDAVEKAISLAKKKHHESLKI